MRHRNITIFYVLSMSMTGSYVAGNWLFFWLRYMTYGQLGIIDACAFAFGLVMEVPTGAVSDMLGKKRTLMMATALTTLGIFTMTAAQDKWWIIIGFLMTQAGWAFYSGAAEALTYDTLKAEGAETQFDKVIARSNMNSIIIGILTALIGGLVYNLHFRLPHGIWGVSNTIGFLSTFFVIEPPLDTVKFSLRNYFHQLGEGARQLMQPALRRYVPLIFALLGVYYLYSFGLVMPAMASSFGFYADEQAIIAAGFGVLMAVLVSQIPRMREAISDMRGLAFLALLLGGGFALAAFDLGFIGIFALLLITVAGKLAIPWTSVVVNREIPSQYRATTLSTVALVGKIPYVLSAIIAGQMIEAGQLGRFNAVIGGGVLLILGVTLVNAKVKMQKAKLIVLPNENAHICP